MTIGIQTFLWNFASKLSIRPFFDEYYSKKLPYPNSIQIVRVPNFMQSKSSKNLIICQ